MSDLVLMDIFNQDILTSTELCTLEFLTSQVYFYHSGKHAQHDNSKLHSIQRHKVVTSTLFSTDCTTPNIQSHYPGCKDKKLLQARSFLMGKYSSFFHKMRCILCIVFLKGQVLKASQESKYKSSVPNTALNIYCTIVQFHTFTLQWKFLPLPHQIHPKTSLQN